MTLSSSPLMLSTCVWKDGSHAYSFRIWWEARNKEGDEGVEGIVENTEKEGWGNKGRAFIPYVIKHMWWMQYNRRHCRLTFPFS